MRGIRIIALLVVLALVGAWTWAWVTRPPGATLTEAFAARYGAWLRSDGGTRGGGVGVVTGLSLGGPFALVDATGRAVTEAEFSSGWMLIYFGYTYCPDVCPTELGTLVAAIDAMGELGEKVAPVFITIDPERDTPAALADYVSRFHPRLRGLTGTATQVGEVARRYRVYFARAAGAGTTDYLMDHSSFIYLVGPDAKVRALFRPQTSPEDIATAIAGRIRAG